MTFENIGNPPSSSQSSSIEVSVYQADGVTLIDSLTSASVYTVSAEPASFNTAYITPDSD